MEPLSNGSDSNLNKKEKALESKLIVKNENKPITISWENIDVWTPSAFSGPTGNLKKKIYFFKKEIPSKNIIRKVNGIAKPGSLMAFMGASGAGKTTLLNVLNFRNRGNLIINGDVKINGEIVKTPAEVASLSGYVQQDDLFIATLKVKEQLKFQAMLRMDKSISDEDKMKRIEEVIFELNLKKCENTIIGASDKGIKGISGGEKRRLSFACELLTNPNLLFCDEPTSGLDSFMSLSIVECMRKLALKGKTIICTIHQPSSEVFDKFDQLCLLAEGRLAYMGSLNEGPKFFSSNSLSIPENHNPADFYIMNLAIIPANKEECKAKVEKICDSFDISTYNQKLKEDLNEINSNSTRNENSKSASLFKIHNFQYTANVFFQTQWLLWRSVLATLRDPFSTKIAIVQTIVIAVIFGLIYLQISYDQSGVQNVNGILFLLLINVSFTYMTAVINTFPVEIIIFLREHQNGMYSVFSYYLSKIFIDLPKFIFFPFLFATIIYWMSGLNSDGGRFIICCIILILVSNCAVAFGYFLSAASPNSNAALALSAPLLVPQMIFAGFFLNNASVPDYFIWLKYLSWFHYAFELLIINQWDGVESIKCTTTPNKCYLNGSQVIKSLDMKTSNIAVDYIAICCLLVGYRVLTYIILLAKSYKK